MRGCIICTASQILFGLSQVKSSCHCRCHAWWRRKT